MNVTPEKFIRDFAEAASRKGLSDADIKRIFQSPDCLTFLSTRLNHHNLKAKLPVKDQIKEQLEQDRTRHALIESERRNDELKLELRAIQTPSWQFWTVFAVGCLSATGSVVAAVISFLAYCK